MLIGSDTFHNSQHSKALTGNILRMRYPFQTAAALFMATSQLCGSGSSFGAAVADAVPKDRIRFALLFGLLYDL
jgi:hypothetical protein